MGLFKRKNTVKTVERSWLTDLRPEAGGEAWNSPKYSECRHVQLDQDALDRHRIIGLLPDPPDLDHYRLLRTQIQ